MECYIHLENAFKQLETTNQNIHGYNDIDGIKSRLYVLIDTLGDKYGKINDYNVTMNSIIEDCDAIFKINLGERICKVEKETSLTDCQTASMAIDRLKTDQRELNTKNNSLMHQNEHINNQNILLSKNINNIQNMRDDKDYQVNLYKNTSNNENSNARLFSQERDKNNNGNTDYNHSNFVNKNTGYEMTFKSPYYVDKENNNSASRLNVIKDK